ncbi:MAG: glycosyltransferase family 4 protein [Planctomycetia bacterium]
MKETPASPAMFPSLDSLEAAIWPAVALLVFVITAMLVDVMVILAARFRLVDLPNRRSAHSLPTARGGGVAIVFTATVASLLAMLRWPSLAVTMTLGIVLPSLVIAAVGFLDDMRPIRPLVRLVIQVAVAAFMAFILGPESLIVLPSGGQVSLGWLTWPITVLWIVGMINAFNFMDGSDGMAALGAVVAGLLMALLAYMSHSLAAMLIAAFAAAAAGGFLVFNWQPARVFMGDVGSGFLGTMLAAVPLLCPAEQQAMIGVPMVLCLWPYIFDPLLSVIRRIWDRENPFEPHREFLFHRLIRSGVSHARAALLYAALAAVGGALAIGMLNPGMPGGVRDLLPLGVVLMAAGLTFGVESRCRRVPLSPAGSSPSPVSH